jgi:hypothetical protein
MKRPLVLWSAALLAAGCHSSQPSNDPFFARTTVPPPATGSYSNQGPAPYYNSPPAGYQVPGANRGIAPSNPTGQPNNPYDPPGGFRSMPTPGSSGAIPTSPGTTARTSAGGWAARGAASLRQPSAQSRGLTSGSLPDRNTVEQAGYNAPTADSPRAVRAEYSPRVRIRTPNSQGGTSQDGMRRLVSDDKAVDIMDLPSSR